MKKYFNFIIILSFLLPGYYTWGKDILSVKDSEKTINCVKFFNNKIGWAVGDYGIVKTTTDGGESWQDKRTGLQMMIKDLYIIDSASCRIFVLDALHSDYGSLYISTDFGLTWTLDANSFANGIKSFCFVDKNIGFISIWRGLFYKTVDGGKNWNIAGETDEYTTSIQFWDSNKGWCLGSHLFSTTNGGANWIKRDEVPLKHINSFYFLNNDYGWVTGDSGYICRTTNGGRDWQYVNFRNNYSIGKIVFSDSIHGYACAWGGELINTTNGGLTWQHDSFNPYTNVFSFFVADQYTVWIAGDNGLLAKLKNGGYEWQKQNSKTNDGLTTAFFISPKIGWVGANGGVLKTTDGGLKWQKHFIDSTFYPKCVFFIDENTGWIIREEYLDRYENNMMKTTDGGISWSYINMGKSIGNKKIVFLDKLNGYLLTESDLKKSSDGGYTWFSIKPGYLFSLADCFWVNNNIGWVADHLGGLFKTTDAGNSWTKQMSGVSYISSMFFINENMGWCTSDRKVLKTVNGGEKWIQIETDQCKKVFFSDSLHGCFIGAQQIFRTKNGGINWFFDFNEGLNMLNDLFFVDANNGWIVGDNGTIFKFNSSYPLSVKSDNEMIQPVKEQLYQNYPNPFNPYTTIKYEIPRESFVTLCVYNSVGQKVKELVNERKPSGSYELLFNGSDLSSGVYFYRITIDGAVQTKKFIILK